MQELAKLEHSSYKNHFPVSADMCYHTMHSMHYPSTSTATCMYITTTQTQHVYNSYKNYPTRNYIHATKVSAILLCSIWGGGVKELLSYCSHSAHWRFWLMFIELSDVRQIKNLRHYVSVAKSQNTCTYTPMYSDLLLLLCQSLPTQAYYIFIVSQPVKFEKRITTMVQLLIIPTLTDY